MAEEDCEAYKCLVCEQTDKLCDSVLKLYLNQNAHLLELLLMQPKVTMSQDRPDNESNQRTRTRV